MARHVIHKQIVRVELPPGKDVFGIQERLRTILVRELAEELEKMLDEAAPEGTLIRLETLHLNLGTVQLNQLDQQFRQKLLTRLRETLELHVSDGGGLGRFSPARLTSGGSGDAVASGVASGGASRSVADMEAFTYFLGSGRLPWYGSIGDMASWERRLLGLSDGEWRRFGEWLQEQDDRVWGRLAAQCSDGFLETLVLRCRPGWQDGLGALRADWQRIAGHFFEASVVLARQKLWTAVLEVVCTVDPGADSALRDRAVAIFSSWRGKTAGLEAEELSVLRAAWVAYAENGSDVLQPAPGNRRVVFQPETGEETFQTTNSGIVLLYPYLNPFLTALGLLSDRRFVDEEARQRAVLLLHYLATEETEAPEYALVLQKFLCGARSDSLVPARLDITQEEKEECDRLLGIVTRHWAPLNRTSAEGLRTTFLQRPGSLRHGLSGWTLQIENRTVDILLDRLPWPLSVIRLPWMEEMLTVEWKK